MDAGVGKKNYSVMTFTPLRIDQQAPVGADSIFLERLGTEAWHERISCDAPWFCLFFLKITFYYYRALVTEPLNAVFDGETLTARMVNEFVYGPRLLYCEFADGVSSPARIRCAALRSTGG